MNRRRVPGILPTDDMQSELHCGFFSEADMYLDDPYQDEDEDDGRPDWIHPLCVSACMALDLGTCCMYPADNLVREFSMLASRVERDAARLEDGDDPGALFTAADDVIAQLARAKRMLSRLRKPEVLQLICPVGQIGGTLADVCEYRPWVLTDQARQRLAPVRERVHAFEQELWDIFRRIGPAEH